MAAGGQGIQFVNPVTNASAGKDVDVVAGPSAAAQERRKNVVESSTCDSACCPSCLSGFLGGMAFLVPPLAISCWVSGITVVQEEEEVVVFEQGRLRYLLKEPGCYCVNPCCTSVAKVTKKLETLDLPDVKIADKRGSPVVMSGVVTYQVVDSVKATLNVKSLKDFVRNQALAVMKAVGNKYPYSENEGEDITSLKGDSSEVSDEMAGRLRERVSAVGVFVNDFYLTDCSYAREIAASMLVRQQAEAMVDARSTVVDGAISISTSAVERLVASGVPVSDATKERLAANLILAIASDTHIQPTMNLDAIA